MKAECGHCGGKFTIPPAEQSVRALGSLDPGELLARGLHTVPPPDPTDWEPPAPEELARLLPQYQIESMAGRGGMGAVYRGRQERLGRAVAIKILPAELAEDIPVLSPVSSARPEPWPNSTTPASSMSTTSVRHRRGIFILSWSMSMGRISAG